MKRYTVWLRNTLENLGQEKANDLLHSMWWNDLITVEQHCNLYYQIFMGYAYDCTFKQDWLDKYYKWLVEFEEETNE